MFYNVQAEAKVKPEGMELIFNGKSKSKSKAKVYRKLNPL
jgi:hypothetical protein